MKRFLSLIVSFSMTLSLATISVNAAQPLSPTDFSETEIMPLASLYFSFDLSPNEYAYSAETYYITPGDTRLVIETCTWEPPTENVWIGFYNTKTKVDYGVEFSAGKISNQGLTTVNVPNGTYQIIVKNIGDLNIEGTMYYHTENVS